MGYYLIYDLKGNIVSAKETDAPIPHPDWWEPRRMIVPVSKEKYQQVFRDGLRKHKFPFPEQTRLAREIFKERAKARFPN